MPRFVQLVQSVVMPKWGSAAIALVPLLAGCELAQNFKDISDALAGDPEVKDAGKELIKGNFYSLRFDGNDTDGVFVLALEAREDKPARLMLIPFPKGKEACSVGAASRYGTAKSRPGRAGQALEARVPFIAVGKDGQSRSLRFTNFACEVDDVEVPDASSPFDSDFASTPGFLTQTEHGELYFVDPWKASSRLIADGLRPIVRSELALFAAGTSGNWMWTIEHGELVARDPDFRVRFRVGKDVDQVTMTSGNGGPLVVYHQQNGEIYTAPVADPSARQRVEADGCMVSAGGSAKGPRLLYYSPCAERDLVMRELETGTRRVLAEGISNFRIVGERSDGPILLYLTGESGAVGTLWARFGEQTPIKIAEQGHLGLTRLNEEGELRAVLDWGENGGTLSVGEVGKKLETLATNVVYYTSLGVIADWDGTVGTLYQFDQKDRLKPVQANVSTSGIKYDSVTKRALVLVDYDGWQGELTLIRDSKGTPLSKHVRPDSYQFTVQLPTVTILSDLDPEFGTATLKLRETDREAETVVAEGVTEVLEVSWPKAGFLYSVPVGDDNGIWFSEVD